MHEKGVKHVILVVVIRVLIQVKEVLRFVEDGRSKMLFYLISKKLSHIMLTMCEIRLYELSDEQLKV